jgi:predicted acylesterase/phospholipase RssA
MIASASIPGAVSPVISNVEAGGKSFLEMHVDGGVITQVFLYPSRTLSNKWGPSGPVWTRWHLRSPLTSSEKREGVSR